MGGDAKAGAETDDLYQRVVLDHARHPRNQGALPGATHGARGDNPFCGDRWQVSLILDGDVVRAVRYEGAGCAISTAAASLMSEAVAGKDRAAVEQLWRQFEAIVAGEAPSDKAADLAAFAGVRRFPVRVKCARLPWQTLLAALAGGTATVSTE